MTDRRYAALMCPTCGASPEPAGERCPGCGRRVLNGGGSLDLLPDDLRAEADHFAEEYEPLRAAEGWAGQHGGEDPEGGDPQLWTGRVRAVQEAARIFDRRLSTEGRALILDIGSGGGWAARHLPAADVIAIDLVGDAQGAALIVRGDMRRLPVRDSAADGVLFSASMHYAPLHEVLSEAARVLRPGGVLVAVDSPIYLRSAEASRAVKRSRDYYKVAGYPDLAEHYHPIDAVLLRRTLVEVGLELERLELRSWVRRLRAGLTSLVVASRLR